MATAKIYFDVRRALKSGLYPVRIRVIHELKAKFYPTEYSMSRSEFDKIMSGVYLDKEQKNTKAKLDALNTKASKIIEKMEFFSFNAFEKKFYNTGDKSDLLYLLSEKANKFQLDERFGSANLYNQAAALLESYLSSKDKTGETIKSKNKTDEAIKLPIKSLTPDFLKDLQKWALKKQNDREAYSVTTLGMYLVRVKAVINESDISKESNPFGKTDAGKYQIPKSNNAKRPLSQSEIMALYNYESENKTEIFARDMFMFSYLANGMNIVDILKLRWSDIKGNEFSFIRQKTSAKQPDKRITVLIDEDIQAIIDRHSTRKLNNNGYLFDCLSGNLDAVTEFKKVRAIIGTINPTLKRIAKKIGINEDISTYYARHSYATILRDSDVPLSYISQQLGHADLKTTQTYLDKYKTEKVEEYQSKLLKKA